MFLLFCPNNFVTLWPDNKMFVHKVTNMDKEIWKDVCGYEGLYQISSNGRVKRLSRPSIDSLGRKRIYEEKILVNCIGKQTGYPYVNLSKDGKVKTWNIHTLIADAFIPNPYNLPCINHKDENRANSVLSNLERCTYAYNNSYGTARDKRRDSLRKYFERNKLQTKFLKEDVFLSVVQYTLDGEVVGFYKGGYPEVREKTGFGASVSSCLSHKNKTAYGYVWRYVGDDFSYTPRVKNITDKFRNAVKAHQKYVIKIDLDGKEVEKYKSVSEAGRKNGFDRHLLSNNQPIDGIFYVNGMRFIVEQKENEYIPKGHKGPRPDLKGHGAKPVCQYDKEGIFIREFNSTIEAAEFMGNKTYSPEITNCCKGRLKTARGFLWTYKGEKKPKPFKSDTLRKIEQYSIDGKYINTYNSIKEAATIVGNGKPGSIGNNLKGISHSAFGYIWKYAKEE